LARPKSVTFAVPSAARRHVRRLQVAVDDAPGVGVGDGPGQLLGDGRGVRRRGRPAAADPLGERRPVHELEGEVGQPGGLAHVEDLDDVRVLEPGDGPGLGEEPGDGRRGRGVRAGEDHLERDHPVQPGLPGLVHDPHPAAAQLPEHLVPGHVRDLVRLVQDELGVGDDGGQRPEPEPADELVGFGRERVPVRRRRPGRRRRDGDRRADGRFGRHERYSGDG
jgi:hypothetical protein